MALIVLAGGARSAADDADAVAAAAMACGSDDDEERCVLKKPRSEAVARGTPMAEASEETEAETPEEQRQLQQGAPRLHGSRRQWRLAVAVVTALLVALAVFAVAAVVMREAAGTARPSGAGPTVAGEVVQKFSSQMSSKANPPSLSSPPPGWARIGPLLTGLPAGELPSNISAVLANLSQLTAANASRDLSQMSSLKAGLVEMNITYPSKPTRIRGWRPQAEFATRCVIDVTQGVSHLGQAITATYGASQCKDDSKAGCAANVLGIVAALAQASAFLSLSASHCSGSMISEAMCSEDISDMSNAFLEIAQSAAGVVEDCNYVPLWGPPEDWKNHGPASRRLRQSLQLPFPKPSEAQQADLDRSFDQVNCGLDIVTATMYLANSIFLIKDAATNCPEPEACTVDVLNVLATFAYVAQYLSLVASDCPIEGNQRGSCSADIADIVGSAMSIVAVGIVLKEDCTDHPNKTVEAMFSHLPR